MSSVIVPIQDHRQFEQSDSEKLGDEITELCGYIYAATHHLLELIQSCAHWLNFKCGFGMNSARERLRVAHALGGLPKISEKFSEGAISYSKVRAITRVANETNEEYLLMVATHGTAHHVERLVSHLVKALEMVVKALEMAIDEQDVTAETSEDPEPIAARRADALCEIAEAYMNNAENSGSTADRYQVVVHVGARLAGDIPRLENGPHVTAETSRRIACDCSKSVITEDESGEPLNIGRRSRTIPPPMRRALKARDGGCRFPGCTNHKFVDGHHIEHWADGGETSLDNLVLLCRHHHHLVHEGGFDCKRSKDGEIYFLDQKERHLEPFPTSSETTLEESLAWMYREFKDKDVSAVTPAAKWYAGEEMDWEHAVSLLF
jgi:hypothetical protein